MLAEWAEPAIQNDDDCPTINNPADLVEDRVWYNKTTTPCHHKILNPIVLLIMNGRFELFHCLLNLFDIPKERTVFQ